MTSSQWSLFWGNFWVAAAITVACFVVGELTSNVSQVDKLWSIVPVLYCWIATIRGDFDARMVLMAVLATVWGVRLTYNFSRQGGYTLRFWSGVEDYRWVHVRSLPVLQTRAGWTLFDLLFICVFQNALLLWITTPIISVHGANRPLGVLDWLLVVTFLALVASRPTRTRPSGCSRARRSGARPPARAAFVR